MDKLQNLPYFIIIFALRGIIIVINTLNGFHNAYGLYEIVNFESGGILFYVSGILGIALWLRIAYLLTLLPKKINLLIEIGKNTKGIMIFHLFGFFFFNLIFGFFCTLTPVIPFDKEFFMTHIYHTSEELVILPLLYMAFGIAFSVIVSKAVRLAVSKIRNMVTAGN